MYKIMGIHFTNWAWLYSPLSFFMRIRVYPKSVSKETFFNQHNGKAIVYVLPRMSVMDTIVLNKTLKTFEQKKISTVHTGVLIGPDALGMEKMAGSSHVPFRTANVPKRRAP